MIRAITFSHNGPEDDVVRQVFALSSKFEYLQSYPTISTRHPRLWMCVCARVLTPLHEHEMWMIQIKAFLSLVPLNVGPSATSRGLDSMLRTVLIHCCSASFPKQDVLSEELRKEGNV